MMREDGEKIGLFEVRALMWETVLVSNKLGHMPSNKRRLSGLTFQTS